MEAGTLVKIAVVALMLSGCTYDAPGSPACMAACDAAAQCNDGGYRYMRCTYGELL